MDEFDSLSVVIPVKDERDNIAPLAAELREALGGFADWEVVFVDDGSTDGTPRELDELAAADGHFKVVRLARNYGQSAATQAGLDAATGAVVVTLDGDGQNVPADIPLLVAKLAEGFDAVLGLRAARQDGLFLRLVPSWVANWLIRRVLRVPYRDFGCTLRAMRRGVAAELCLYGEMHRFITPLILQSGAAVAQIPVRHRPRVAGRSKYTLSRAVRVALDVLTVKFLGSYFARPMHLFGAVGLAMVVVASALLVTSLMMKYTTGPGMTQNPLTLLGVMLELMGVQFLSLGLLGEALARIYFEGQGRAAYRVRERLNFGAPGGPSGRELGLPSVGNRLI